MIPVLTPIEAAQWDASAVASGRPLNQLMDAAGRSVAHTAIRVAAESVAAGVLVACGSGNNGGDGWVAARLLHRLGFRVAVVAIGESHTDAAGQARHAAISDGVAQLTIDESWFATGVIIDALLGRGASGELRSPVAELVARIVASGLPVISVDGPTGLDLATGERHGQLRATHTVTFGALQRGHLLARDVTGVIHVAEIGLPRADPVWPRLFDRTEARTGFRTFGVADYKGLRGRVVIVGGSSGMNGAARLSARAAFAAGAGLVHVVTDAEAARELITAEPDVQVRSHDLTALPDRELTDLIQAADVVVLGPGLGRGTGRAALVEKILQLADRVVLDADGLRAFAGRVAVLRGLTESTATILTPHAGEFAALWPGLAETDRWTAVAGAQAAVGQTVVFKGVPTVIAADHGPVHTVARGNPGLATGGSGDVLSGIIAALWCSHDDPLMAASLATLGLGQAADRSALVNGARGMRPMDVIQSLAECWSDWAATDTTPRHDLLTLSPPATA